MEPRKLTKEDIDKVRNIEGFPIGTDEDIIALSDAPYSTACPNPFIEEFIKENGTPYDEATDDYHREPFAADVSEGKNDPVYTAHSYHTKVPYKAIMRYILHYTKPGDIVFDGFCGTGMTGVAAQMCGVDSPALKSAFVTKGSNYVWGTRKAILTDLSPVATLISHSYNSPLDNSCIAKQLEEIISSCEESTAWMYRTKHVSQSDAQIILETDDKFGTINFVVWSDVFICPNCGDEFVFYDVAASAEKKEVADEFHCPACNSNLKKRECKRSQTVFLNKNTNKTSSINKTVPVMIDYTYHGKRYVKKPDAFDMNLIEKIEAFNSKYSYPCDEIVLGDKTNEAIRLGITSVDLIYYRRSLLILAELFAKVEEVNPRLKVVLTSIASSLCSKTTRYNMGNRGNGAMPGVIFIPSLVAETNVFKLLRGKARDFAKAFSVLDFKEENAIVQCASSTELDTVSENTIDYIFVDPPFGDNLMYSELNFVSEAWLKVKTNNASEAIVNKTQKKAFVEYQELMTKCFAEFYRILKPNRWMTVEFHNSKNSVWNAIQESLGRVGFVIADVRTLDKNQGSFNQVKGASQAIKQDLVISAYRPKDSFKREIAEKAGSEETAWSFVRQHLENIPVVNIKNDKIEIVSERQAYLLFDRMVAYHIMQGIPVPLDATDFYKGLDERFLKRDNMYFLPDQVNEYDTARIKTEVEQIQFSLFVTNEKTAISWLYQQLDEQGDGPQTYAEIQPKFMQEVKSVDRYEAMPELAVLLEENFLQDDKGRWYIPDVTKEGDVAKLREKKLWKEFEGYLNSKGKLKSFRSEAIRVGFSRLWKDKNYQAIVDIAERLPESTIQEDPNLLMYYDISLGRV